VASRAGAGQARGMEDVSSCDNLAPVSQQSPGARRGIERASVKPAAYLHHLPRWLPPVVVAALFVGGLYVRGWTGTIMLLLVAAALAWLAALSWPAVSAPGRLLRVAVIAGLVALALWQGLR
jgi:hypothetical protein